MRRLKYKMAALVANLQSQLALLTKPLLLPKSLMHTQSFSQRQCVQKPKRYETVFN
jgi:hypothetical protein